MNPRVAACAIAASLLPAALAAQPVPSPASRVAERLTLAAAIQLAVDHNVELQSAQLQVEKAEASVAIARSRRLPTFDTEISASQLLSPVEFAFPKGAFGTFPETGPIPDTDTTVRMERRPVVYTSTQIAQPITQLFRINLGVKSAAVGRELERERVRSARLSVVNAVKRLYYAVLQTRGALDALEADLTFSRELVRTMEVRLTERVVLPADTMDVKLRLAQQELTRTTTRNTLASQKEQLNRLLGRDIATEFEVEAVPAASLLEMNPVAARGQALDQRSDVRQARLALKQAELDVRVSQAGRIPDVSVAISYTANANMDVVPRSLASAGVQVKWEPFDWGRRKRDLASKAHTVTQARLAVRDAEDKAAIEVNTRLRAIAEARGQLELASLAQGVAREKLRVKNNQFAQQAALLPDVLNLRAEVENSNTRYQQALLAFWMAKADFELAVGEE
jgi:outer membrane protein TolC